MMILNHVRRLDTPHACLPNGTHVADATEAELRKAAVYYAMQAQEVLAQAKTHFERKRDLLEQAQVSQEGEQALLD